MSEETKKPRILLIEDDVFMVELLVREFHNAGFEVTVAETGSAGIEKFKETSPDLILLDVLLPDKNGLEALREIRRLPNGPHTKVIVLSNVAETVGKEEAERLAALDYMVKSNFTIPEIIEKVRSAL